jgi:hypothetical protein
MRLPRKRGSTSNMVRIFIPDNSATNGAGLVGLTSASTNLAIAEQRARDAASKVRFGPADATYQPGTYEVQFHDSATAFGAADASDHVVINILETSTTALHIGPCRVMIPLVPWDPQDAARLGLTNIATGLPGASNGAVINGVNAGPIHVDVASVGGVTAYASDGTLVGGSSSSVTFPTTDSSAAPIPDDGRYAYASLMIVAGTGFGQVITLGASLGSRQYAVVGGMPVACDNTSQYTVLGTTNASLTPAGLDLVTATEISSNPTNFRQMMRWLFQRFHGNVAKSTGSIIVKTSGGATATTQATTDDGSGNQTQGIAS